MNNIFEKNINALKTKGIKEEKLADKLLSYILTDAPQLVRENNCYNFLYKGKLLHNPQSPLGEAAEIFSMCENTPVTIHLVYGLGLGYLFQVVSAKSQGTVILYEPDLNQKLYHTQLLDKYNNTIIRNKDMQKGLYDLINKGYIPKGADVTPSLDKDGNPFSVMEHDKILNRLSISLPSEIELSIKLKLYGLIDKIEPDISKLVNTLWE